jgi:hypothetical protein
MQSLSMLYDIFNYKNIIYKVSELIPDSSLRLHLNRYCVAENMPVTAIVAVLVLASLGDVSHFAFC